MAELEERERRVREVEATADRMDGLGVDYLSANRHSARIDPPHGVDVLQFIADLWRK